MQVELRAESGEYRSFSGEPGVTTAAEPNETVWTLPAGLGRGGFRRFQLASGSSVSVSQCKTDDKYLARVSEDAPSCALVFVLAGCTRTRNAALRTELNMTAGAGYLHCLPDPVLQREIDARQCLHAVSIKTPFDRLGTIVGQQIDHLPSKLRDAMIAYRDRPYVQLVTMTPAIRMSLLQITDCPYGGLVRRIFLESKVTELLAHTFAQVAGHDPAPAAARRMSADEVERIRNVRDLLQRDLQNPPSLAQLCRTAGMSHTRLNWGFRQVFGCTVFEYLRRQRLELAKLLLAANDMSITEVAHCTGFCSSSHFAAAFLRRYGIQPSLFRRAPGGGATIEIGAC